MTSATPDLRYPIGRFSVSGAITEDRVGTWLGDLVALPDDLRRTVTPLSDPQLDTPYRPGGWTVRQVVHHLPDSHLNCFLRFRWALTEDRPVIKPQQPVNKVTRRSTGDASRLIAALCVPIRSEYTWYSSQIAPCQPGASPISALT